MPRPAPCFFGKRAERSRTKATKRFMAVARWCGHDSRGHEIPHDDIPAIQAKFGQYRDQGSLEYDHLGFTVLSTDIVDEIFLPKYYNPEIRRKLQCPLKVARPDKIRGTSETRGSLSCRVGTKSESSPTARATFRLFGRRTLRTGRSRSIRSTD